MFVMFSVTPLRRLPQYPLLRVRVSSRYLLQWTEHIPLSCGNHTLGMWNCCLRVKHTLFRGKNIVCWGELRKLEKPSYPSVLPSEGMLSFILSYWFRTIIQYAWTPISALSLSERIDLRPWSASLSDWCAVEMKTSQITNEIWLRFPRAPAVRQDGERVCETFGLMQTRIWITPPVMSPTSYRRLVLRWGMGCCKWVSVGLPPLMARKCLCWRD